MNRWYVGYIEGHPVEVFLSDDFSIDYFLDDDHAYPVRVRALCEEIREGSKAIRSLSGAQKLLAENGWSNS